MVQERQNDLVKDSVKAVNNKFTSVKKILRVRFLPWFEFSLV